MSEIETCKYYERTYFDNVPGPVFATVVVVVVAVVLVVVVVVVVVVVAMVVLGVEKSTQFVR